MELRWKEPFGKTNILSERASILQRVVVESIGGLILLQNSVVAVPVLIGDVDVQHQIVVTHHLLHQVVEVSVNVQISLSNSPFFGLEQCD